MKNARSFEKILRIDVESFIRNLFFQTFGMLPIRVTGRDAVEGDDVAVGGGHPVLFSRVTE